MKGRKFKRKNEVLLIAWMIAMGAISLAYYWCMTDLAYRGDDWLNANASGVPYYTGESIGELTVRIGKNWLAMGRFFPCSNYTYYLFSALDTLHAYRIFMFCITVIMVLLSGLVIRKLTKSHLMTASFMTLAPMMFWLSEHDACNALLSYHGLVQFTVIWFMCSMLCLLAWTDTKKGIYAILTMLFYLMSLFTYEVAYVYIVPAAFVVVYGETDMRKALKKMTPLLVAFAVGIIVNIICRIGAQGEYPGVAMSFSVSKIISTALCMMAAAFPIYNAFATDFVFGPGDVSRSSMLLSTAFALMFVAAFYVFKDKETRKRDRVIIYCMGACWWILPAFLMGVSAKYQNDIRWGTAWLPYLAEVTGTSIILVQLCRDMYQTIAHSACWKWMKHVLSFCLFIVVGYSALWNRTAAENSYSKMEMNAFYTIQNALESGILDGVGSDDVVHVVPTVGSENEPDIFYSRFAKKKINADILNGEGAYDAADYAAYKNEYVAKKIQLDPENHIFVVGRMENGILDKISWPLVYIPGARDARVMFTTESNGAEESKEAPGRDILKTSGENGKIVQIPHENVILDSIRIQ